jgi:hypothetical protein
MADKGLKLRSRFHFLKNHGPMGDVMSFECHCPLVVKHGGSHP